MKQRKKLSNNREELQGEKKENEFKGKRKKLKN